MGLLLPSMFLSSIQLTLLRGNRGVAEQNKRLLVHVFKFRVFTISVCNGAVDEFRQLIEDGQVQIKF